MLRSRSGAAAAVAVIAAMALLLAPLGANALRSRPARGLRRLQQATSSATAVAGAGAGGNANAVSTSNVISTGPPASGVSQAIVFAPPGKSVTVVCDVYAKNTNEYKTCVGAAQAASAASEPVAWESAPPCNRTAPSAGVKDNKGNLWGYENRSCAIRPAGNPPSYPPPSANASANASAFAAVSFAAAPACAPGDPSTGVRDTAGRFWGFQNGTSCAYKDPAGNAILPAPINPPGGNATAAGVPAPANATSPSPAPVPPPAPAPAPAPTPSPSSATAQAAAAAQAGAGRRRYN